ncbi:hypothetical protein [Carnobacterium maltaromaticum]|uniref:hypothetical protein n=1 Tax=Carnobacterium maltaromaticum TaxID=2751 RepID=UPI0007050494|nr:hypothetical protein [Carnobacterium maltaromaticum]
MSTEILIQNDYHHLSKKGTFAKKDAILSILKESAISNGIKKSIDYISTSNCNIEGSNELIELFKKTNLYKYDYKLPLDNIKYKMYKDNEITLEFKIQNDDDDTTLTFDAVGHYHFTDDFLDSQFQLKNFANYCRNNNQKELLDTILEKLLSTTKNSTRQYRFIEPRENEILLRGITSTQYKIYDNDLIIYISLNALNLYSERTKNKLYIKNATISDSKMNVSINMKNKYTIDKDTKVEVGVRVHNNEIKEGSFSIEFIYTLIDKDNVKADAIGDKVISIPHRLKAETIKTKLTEINNLDVFTTDIISAIKAVNTSKKLSDEQLYKIFNDLSHATQKLSKNTRTQINKLDVTNNTLSLIKIFNKLEDIASTVDEKTFIQSKLNEFISTNFR